MPRWAADTNRLRTELPSEVQAVLERHEAARTADAPAFEWIIFETSSHMPHLEETERFLHLLTAFPARVGF